MRRSAGACLVDVFENRRTSEGLLCRPTIDPKTADSITMRKQGSPATGFRFQKIILNQGTFVIPGNIKKHEQPYLNEIKRLPPWGVPGWERVRIPGAVINEADGKGSALALSIAHISRGPHGLSMENILN